jgi:hypothetical protein
VARSAGRRRPALGPDIVLIWSDPGERGDFTLGWFKVTLEVRPLKKLALTIVALTMLATPAAAQVMCRDDVGRVTCYDIYGNSVVGTKDVLGKATWVDEYGNQVSVRRDVLGNRIIEDSDGNRTSVRRDVLGNTVVTDDRGNKSSCRVDLLGKARCK